MEADRPQTDPVCERSAFCFSEGFADRGAVFAGECSVFLRPRQNDKPELGSAETEDSEAEENLKIYLSFAGKRAGKRGMRRVLGSDLHETAHIPRR